MKRWVGLGVIADNLTHIGTVLAERKNWIRKVSRNQMLTLLGGHPAGLFAVLGSRSLETRFCKIHFCAGK